MKAKKQCQNQDQPIATENKLQRKAVEEKHQIMPNDNSKFIKIHTFQMKTKAPSLILL